MTSDDLGCDPITHQRRAMIASKVSESTMRTNRYDTGNDVIVVNGAPTFKRGDSRTGMKETTSTAKRLSPEPESAG